MHKVLNAGSALQAWALYETVEQLGYTCELIDYQYPNYYHQSRRQNVEKKSNILYSLIIRFKYFVLYRSRLQKRRFMSFWKSAWKSTVAYATPESLMQNPPQYDIYIVGSDQVWNPKCMFGDPSFFCAFAGDKPRISYASSFATSEIPKELRCAYKESLSHFFAISVREEGGRNLLKGLIGKDSVVVCDPTLLLTPSDYGHLLAHSKIKIKQPYILAYILSYAYDPYPTIHEVIDRLSKERGIPVIYLMANTIDDYHIGRSITSAGPNEFVRLIADAECVVTSSFHGVAFALNFEKEFYTVLPEDVDNNNRIYSLLEIAGALDRIVTKDSNFSLQIRKLDYRRVRSRIQSYREKSISYLKKVLEECVYNM